MYEHQFKFDDGFITLDWDVHLYPENIRIYFGYKIQRVDSQRCIKAEQH